jgi:hypothetical protein
LEDVVSEEAVVDVSKRLIIDASIAGAAGKERPADAVYAETTVLTPKNCRDVLNAVRRFGFRMTMTPEIVQEWDDHQGSFALAWLVAMRTADRIEIRDSCHNEDLRNRVIEMAGQKIGQTKITEEICQIILKDCHLLEAALTTDKVILALDEKARKPLKTTAQVVEEISPIVWVNPDKPEEGTIAWLEAGAEPEKHRQLGFR